MKRSTLLCGFLVFCALFALAGCVEPTKSKLFIEIPKDHASRVTWRKFQIGNGPVGYLKPLVRKVEGEAIIDYWVYNSLLEQVGFYSAQGATYKVTRDGGLKFLGIVPAEDSIRLIFNTSGEIRFLRMKKPATL
jgi:hypothetical protein